ncbi:MAG TPA: MmcQ/YjbR family DNA-binding protein [Acidimicrobiales bacterium]
MATLEDVRRACLALPEAEERETWGHPTFRVRGKMFAAAGGEPGEESASFKADPEERAALLAEGEPWFVPAYVGRYGWLGVRLVAEVDPDELAELLTTSWRLTAPKRVVARFDAAG